MECGEVFVRGVLRTDDLEDALAPPAAAAAPPPPPPPPAETVLAAELAALRLTLLV